MVRCSRVAVLQALLPAIALLCLPVCSSCSCNIREQNPNPSPSASPADYDLGIFAELGKGTAFEIFALHPYPHRAEAALEGETAFHGYEILGQSTLEPIEFLPLLQLIALGESENDDMAAMCFNPRHGIRVSFADGTTQSLVICFECMQIYQYEGSERSAQHLTSNDHSSKVSQIYRSKGLKIHEGE